MRVVRVWPGIAPESAELQEAAAILRGGGLVAFPTETVYGLGAAALDPVAVQKIFEAKGRPAANPLIVHVASIDEARALASRWPEEAQLLADHFWPGPLTIVVPKAANVPSLTSGGLETVALRIPAHPVALALLRAARIAIAAPSANRSTELSPTMAEHVVRSLGARVDLILDGGPTTVGIESTVVDLSVEPPVILRPGMLGLSQIAPIIPRVVAELREKSDVLRAPGMMERHYSPHARVILVNAEEVPAVVESFRAHGMRIGIAHYGEFSSETDVQEKLPREAEGYAQQLYSALHRLDEQGCDVVLLEEPPASAEWTGVRDRIRRMGA